MEEHTMWFIVSCVVFFGGFIVYYITKDKGDK